MLIHEYFDLPRYFTSVKLSQQTDRVLAQSYLQTFNLLLLRNYTLSKFREQWCTILQLIFNNYHFLTPWCNHLANVA